MASRANTQIHMLPTYFTRFSLCSRLQKEVPNISESILFPEGPDMYDKNSSFSMHIYNILLCDIM